MWFAGLYESCVLELDYTCHAVCLFLNAFSKHNAIELLVVLPFFNLYRLFILSFRLQTHYSGKIGFSLFCRGTTDSAVLERHHWLVVQGTLLWQQNCQVLRVSKEQFTQKEKFSYHLFTRTPFQDDFFLQLNRNFFFLRIWFYKNCGTQNPGSTGTIKTAV